MSVVREAIEAVLQAPGHVQIKRQSGEVHGDLVDRLVAAVEAVPMRVTIRELDMGDNENIVTVRDETDIEYLQGYVMRARQDGALHLTVDGGYLKVKAGDYGTWCAPIKTEVYNP